jgi:predicted CoA-binding protein
MTNQNIIDEVLASSKIIAMVGASAKPDRPSYRVMQFMQERDYRVIPVNPGLAGQELHGEIVQASLTDISEPVDMVDIFRQADQCPAIVDDAIAIGAKSVWMQLAIIHDEAAAKARAAGLKVVMDRCPKIELERRD